MTSFPAGLIDCIKDARLPLDGEVASVAAKLWDEGLRFLPGCSFETALSMAVQVLSAGLL
jgi:hypothetical protein